MALNVNPSSLLLDRSAYSDLRRVSVACVRFHFRVVEGRARMLAMLSGLFVRLPGVREMWTSCFSLESSARRLNFPLMYFVTKYFVFDDVDFTHDLAVGIPIAGDVPDVRSIRPRIRPAIFSLGQ